MTKKFLTIVLLFSLFLETGCTKDDPEVANDEELITTIKYTLTPASGGTAIVYTFKDLDGDGPEQPVITNSGNLTENTTYNGVLELWNELEDPAEDVTAEIKTEDEDHQFFFDSKIFGMTVAYEDKDANNNPLGLATTLVTLGPGNGTLNIKLKHEPNKSASGVADGDITNAGGETEVDITFNISVE